MSTSPDQLAAAAVRECIAMAVHSTRFLNSPMDSADAVLKALAGAGYVVVRKEPTEDNPPCGGCRCYRAPDGRWIYTSKSYSSCSVNRKDDEFMGGFVRSADQGQKPAGGTDDAAG